MRGAARLTLAALLLAGCGSESKKSEPLPRPGVEDFGLPPVRAALVFPPEAREVSLAWLVDELARLSGQELALAPELRLQLQDAKEPLEQTAPVPPDEVYAFVEALLARLGLLVAPLTAGTRPVLGIYGSPQERGTPRAVAIELQQVAALARHPALLCQVLLNFENIDSRQLQTQLRQLFVESSGLQQVVPAGERSLILQASGAKLLALVSLLQQIDRVSEQRARPSPEPTEAAKAASVPRTQ